MLKLESILIDVKNPIVNKLIKPENSKNIIELLENYKLGIVQDFIDLYSWKNGIDSALIFDEAGYENELTSYGSFFELSSLLSYYELELITGVLYNKKYFAFFYSIAGDRILIDLEKKSKTFGKIFIYAPSITLSSEPIKIFDSLELMIDTIIQCYEKKAYTIIDGELNINFDLESEISKKMNRESEFWD